MLANTARQNASGGPVHPARYGDFTKNPLVLHNTAATNTNHRAAKTVGPRPRPKVARRNLHRHRLLSQKSIFPRTITHF